MYNTYKLNKLIQCIISAWIGKCLLLFLSSKVILGVV